MSSLDPSPLRSGVIPTIWALAGDRRSIVLRSVGFKVLQALSQAVPIAVIVVVIDRLRAGEVERRDAVAATVIVAASLLSQWVFGYLSNRAAWVSIFHLFAEVRLRALDHLRTVSMGFHDERRVGDTAAALTEDVAAVERFAHEPMQQMIGAFASAVAVTIVLLFVDRPMAAVTSVSIIVSIPVFIWSNRAFARLARQRQAMQADASSRIIEYVDAMPVIRSFRLTGDRLQVFRTALDGFRSANMEMIRRVTPLGLAFTAVVMLGIPTVLYFGGRWFIDETIDAGTLIVFAVLVLRVYEPLVVAAANFEGMRLANASLARVAAIFDTPAQSAPASPAPVEGSDVEFKNVTFAYEPGMPALADVSFTARRGQMTAIVGPSGAGKSTLLDLTVRFWDPDDGAIRIGGADLRSLTPEQLFAMVTVVFQNVYLFPGTIADNIAFGKADATRAEIEHVARAARAHDFIVGRSDGYDTVVEEGGQNLSGGERQRIAIARSMLKDAPIVLLDEATSALDATNERLVSEALAGLVASKTVIVVAHKLSTIRSADQIVVLDDGRVVATGRHDQLIESCETYQRLWGQRSQAEGWQLGERRDASVDAR